MSVIVDQAPLMRPRPAQGCSRCGQPRSTHIVLRAQLSNSRCRPLAASARGLCEACALDVFTALEDELERQIAGAPRRARELDEREGHDG